MTEIAGVISQNMKRMRADRGWSQDVLAERSELSLDSIRNIESGRAWVSTDSVSKLARAFRCNESELFLSSTAPAPSPKDVLRSVAYALGVNLNPSAIEKATLSPRLVVEPDKENMVDALLSASPERLAAASVVLLSDDKRFNLLLKALQPAIDAGVPHKAKRRASGL